jgi:nicotinamidase-related amidase
MFTGLEKYVRKENTALVVWDVQEALVGRIFNREKFVTDLKDFISWARVKRIPIFYTEITPLPERYESIIRKISFSAGWNPGNIIKEIYPEKDDIILRKNTASIFTGTNFELILRNGGITNIIFTGIATEIGIETSARHSLTLGFLPIVVEELVSSGDRDAHERSLKNMSKLMPVMKIDEVKKLF